ncbi:hypothetical protein Nepgr_029429 [Nepenthes gracilis]|uniref:Uncharacterized protein n=1 Tax=Nepenthes gracilis TaxID=150966 RepID=A0AAD3Y5J2_NEPGR|nr:hypothetical protein Nepgr_029429 [Nepenthes gracilis]
MGTKVQFDYYSPGDNSMRDLSCESNKGSWLACYGDNGFHNGQNYYGFLPRDSDQGYEKDIVKQTMVEHDAVFKNQVYELHRLYRVQRDLMDEFRRKEQFKQRIHYEESSSSVLLPSQMPSENAPKWNLINCISSRPTFLNSDVIQTSENTIRGKSIQTGPISFQNCLSPKDSEASEFRPTKFIKKMLNLQLPVDEYIDTEEKHHCKGAIVSDTSNDVLYRNHKFAPESGAKLFLTYSEKAKFHGEALRSDSGFRRSNTMVDLNKPIQLKEATEYPSVDFLDCVFPLDGSWDPDFSFELLGRLKDVSQNSRHRSMNGTSNSVHYENGGNPHGWFSYMLEAEQSKGRLRSMHQAPQPEKVPGPSQSVQFLLKQTYRSPGFLPSDHIKGDSWKAKKGAVFGTSERNYFDSICNSPESSVACTGPSLSFTKSSDVANSCDHCVLLLGKLSSCFNRSVSVQPNLFPTSATSSKSSQLTSQNNELVRSNPRANSNFGSELPLRYGFHLGPSLGSKKLSACFASVNFDEANPGHNDNMALGSSEFFKSTSCVDKNSAKDLSSNSVLLNNLSSDPSSQQGLKIVGREQKQEEPHAVLPWLRVMAVCSNEAANAGKDPNSLLAVMSMDGHNSFVSTSCDGHVTALRCDIDECSSSRKILSVPIFEKSLLSRNEVSSLIGPSCSRRSGDEEIISSPRMGVFDINVPCDPMDPELWETAAVEVLVLENRKETQRAHFRDRIDLNSSLSEYEVTWVPKTEEGGFPCEKPTTKQHGLPSQLPRDKAEDPEAKLAIMAAEVMVSISASVLDNHAEETTTHPGDASPEDLLHWFVGVVCSFMDDLGTQTGADTRQDGIIEGCLSCESDYFESMTLKLTACDAEESLSKPRVPESPNVEAMGINLLENQIRKGPARRGRQRRDFPRDILPGLASLSRHEVAEDLQSFEGLMRATGHAWHPGSRKNATRNGSRGRYWSSAAAPPPPPPANTNPALLKQQQLQLNTSEVGLRDRSLVGWGKTTRRPRRQRFPAGSPAAVALT